MSLRILNYIGPVAPEALLDKIEAEFISSNFADMQPRSTSQRTTILNLLRSLAYEPSAFDRCIRLLICATDCEQESNNSGTHRDKITKFFQAYVSGTHASLAQRIAVMNECFNSDVAGRRSLGLRMLSVALAGPPWSGSELREFGARPRDYGFYPKQNELAEWRSAFVDIAVRLGTSNDPDLEECARLILANKFRGMWNHVAMREKLVDAFRKLHAHQPFGEGWKAVRSTIYFDYGRRNDRENLQPLPEELSALERELQPEDLIPAIKTYVLGKGDHWSLDSGFYNGGVNDHGEAEKRIQAKALRLGEDFAVSPHGLDDLGASLFAIDWLPYRAAFGRGLAKGAHDVRIGWRKLVNYLALQTKINMNFIIFGGFIEEVDSFDTALAQELLDECARHPQLRQVLVGLHPQRGFTEVDLSRCEALFDDLAIDVAMFGPLLWRDDYDHLPMGRMLNLARRLLIHPNGDDVVLDALSMKLHDKDSAVDTLGVELRLVGLRAAITRFRADRIDRGGHIDYAMNIVVAAALRFDGNEAEKLEWLDTIFAVVDGGYGYVLAFEKVIQTTAAMMPRAFLERVFEGTEEQRRWRLLFVSHGSHKELPLAKIDIDVLIRWCDARNDNSVWGFVAGAIGVWSHEDEQEVSRISESAIKLLEASNNPEAVLEAYAELVSPSAWSGSLAEAMRSRAAAIDVLANHKSAGIAAAASSISEKLASRIDRTKMREQIEDEGREQRFE